jgi:transcriptional regulator with XRE-family HTH domain
MDIGKRIRDLREERGLTQREVARRAGLTPSGVGFIENGQTQNPSAETVVAIARALGVRVEALLGEPVPLGEAPPPPGLPVWAAMPDVNTFSRRVSELSKDDLDNFARAVALVSSSRPLTLEDLRVMSDEERGERATNNVRFFGVHDEYMRRGSTPPKEFTLASALVIARYFHLLGQHGIPQLGETA